MNAKPLALMSVYGSGLLVPVDEVEELVDDAVVDTLVDVDVRELVEVDTLVELEELEEVRVDEDVEDATDVEKVVPPCGITTSVTLTQNLLGSDT